MVDTRKHGTIKATSYVGVALLAAGGLFAIRALVRAQLSALSRKSRTIMLKPQCLRCNDDQISIFSMNLLSPTLVSKSRYKYCAEGYLRWEYRLGKLCSLLEQVWPLLFATVLRHVFVHTIDKLSACDDGSLDL
jgi:hypothetical protein